MVVSRQDHAREVRYALADPHKLCSALGLVKGARRQSGGLSIRCPVHGEKNPSCSVTTGPDGTVRVRCFGCDFSGDALTLIAVVEGLSLRAQFRDVLAVGAEIAGALQLRDEILDGGVMPDRRRFEAPAPRAEPEYPPQHEVRALWERAVSVVEDADAWEYLRSRGIDPERAFEAGGVRCLPCDTKTPLWARYGRASWVETGHRLLVAMVDHRGELRSVRGWRIADGDTPKRLPPAKHKATGLVMANRWALWMLRGTYCPSRLLVMEGEPDFLSASVTWGQHGVLGIISGSWSPEFAAAVPRGTRVTVSTHADEAGDRYAAQVIESFRGRSVWRGRIAA